MAAADHPPPQPLLTPPNVLTLLRVVLVPVFVFSWYSTGAHPPAAPPPAVNPTPSLNVLRRVVREAIRPEAA